MSGQRAFVRAASDGRILEDLVWMGGSPGSEFVEVTDRESRRLLALDPEKILLVGDRVVRKPVVELVASRSRLLADGEDEVIVEVSGIPESFDRVRVAVGGQEGELARGETIQITSQTAGVVVVQLREPVLYARALHLVAEVPA